MSAITRYTRPKLEHLPDELLGRIIDLAAPGETIDPDRPRVFHTDLRLVGKRFHRLFDEYVANGFIHEILYNSDAADQWTAGFMNSSPHFNYALSLLDISSLQNRIRQEQDKGMTSYQIAIKIFQNLHHNHKISRS